MYLDCSLFIIVIKAVQPDCDKIKGIGVLLLETPLTRSKYISPHTHAHHLMRTSRTFYTFAYKGTLHCKAGFKHHAVDPASEIEEDPYLLPHQMCGTGCKGGWVTCSLINLWPVNLRHLQCSPCLIRTLWTLLALKMMARMNLMLNVRKKFHLLVQLKPLSNFWL